MRSIPMLMLTDCSHPSTNVCRTILDPFRATDQAITLHCQVEDPRKAQKAAQLPEREQVIKRQQHGHHPTRQQPAPLKMEAENLAAAEHTRWIHQCTRVKFRCALPLQVENSRKAYRAAQSPEEAKVVKRQEQGHEPTRRRPAPLKVEAQDAAAAEHTKEPRRTSSNRGVKLRPMPSSSKQVSICVRIPLKSPLVIVRGFS